MSSQMRSSPVKGSLSAATTGGRRRKPLSEEQFHDDSFGLRDFVEGLSRRAVLETEREQRSAAAGAAVALETEAVRVVLEGALSELRTLDGVLTRRLGEALERCAQSEARFQREAERLVAAQEGLQQQLEAMDARMADNTAAAIGVGERLATASAQRESVDAAAEVVRYLAELNGGDAHSAVFVDPERIHERESVLKNLRLITTGLGDEPRTRVGVAMVESQCRQLERQLLDRFRTAVRSANVPEMQALATSMFDFDGGEACLAAYLEEAFALPKAFRDRLGSDQASAALRKFFLHVTAALDRQQATIEAVFPDPSRVLTSIVEQIFEWNSEGGGGGGGAANFPLSIRLFLERIRSATERASPETHLVLLAEAFDRTAELVQHLSGFAFDRSSVSPERMTGFLFAEARDTYLEKELELQARLYLAKLESSRGLMSPTVLEERRRGASRFPWETADEGAQAIKQISLEDLETSKFLLQQHRAALDRCVKLSHRTDVAANVTSLYKLLLQTLGSSCLVRAVDLHLELMSDRANAKRSVDVSFLYVTLTVNSIILDLEQYHHGQVLPRVAASINEPTKCASLLGKLLATLEQRLSAGLQRLVHVMAGQADALLSARQNRRDFKPPADVLVGAPTQACAAVCEFLIAQHAVVMACLDGGNAQLFLHSLGSLFYDALFAHLKKYSVSLGLGGTQLMMDMSRYVEIIKRFGSPSLDSHFAALRQLVNIHLVDRATIRSLLRELVSAAAAASAAAAVAAAAAAAAGGGAPEQSGGVAAMTTVDEASKKMTIADIREYLQTHEHYNSAWNDFLREQ